MKTATITLHSAHNNGSFLQTFALQKKIKSLGYENELINFIPHAQYALYQNIVFKDNSLKGIVKGLLNLPHYKSLSERRNRFNEIQKFLNLTDKFEEESDFTKVIEEFDILIAGSDQIWNSATMPDFTELYYLPTDKYKISYAPSFGKSLDNQLARPNSVERINNFSCLSVRESSAKKMLTEILPEKDIEVVLDPTFLLKKEEYKLLEDNAKCKYDGDYIFFYCIKASNEVLRTVKELSNRFGLPVITMFTGVNTYKCQIYGQKVDFEAGPSEFVNYIKNAKYVMSNSFHGIVFSIIYNKVFFRIAENDNGKLKVDERLDSILGLLKLESQNIIAGKIDNVNLDINYKEVHNNLNNLKENSSNWLSESLNKNGK